MSRRNDDPFWEMVEGRWLGPPCSRFFGWTCLEIDPDKGTITVAFDPQTECLNPAGGIAGGFLALPPRRYASPGLRTWFLTLVSMFPDDKRDKRGNAMVCGGKQLRTY